MTTYEQLRQETMEQSLRRVAANLRADVREGVLSYEEARPLIAKYEQKARRVEWCRANVEGFKDWHQISLENLERRVRGREAWVANLKEERNASIQKRTHELAGARDWSTAYRCTPANGAAVRALVRLASEREGVLALSASKLAAAAHIGATKARQAIAELERLRVLVRVSTGGVRRTDERVEYRSNAYLVDWHALQAALGIVTASSGRWSAPAPQVHRWNKDGFTRARTAREAKRLEECVARTARRLANGLRLTDWQKRVCAVHGQRVTTKYVVLSGKPYQPVITTMLEQETAVPERRESPLRAGIFAALDRARAACRAAQSATDPEQSNLFDQLQADTVRRQRHHGVTGGSPHREPAPNVRNKAVKSESKVANPHEADLSANGPETPGNLSANRSNYLFTYPDNRGRRYAITHNASSNTVFSW